MAKAPPDMRHVQAWMCGRGLLWDANMELKFATQGISFVEQIKLLSSAEWGEFFKEDTLIMQRQAQAAYEELKATGPFDAKKCTLQYAIRDGGVASASAITSQLPKNKSKTATKKAAEKHSQELFDGKTNEARFTGWGDRRVTVTGKEKKKRRLERKKLAEDQAGLDIEGDIESSNEGKEEEAEDAISLDDDDDELITPRPGSPLEQRVLALPPSNWRAGRCDSSKDLEDPATEDEKIVWDMHLLKALELNLPKDVSDLEDTKGHYEVLGCNKASSDDDIQKAFRRIRKKYHQVARDCHPDKAGGDEGKLKKHEDARADLDAAEAAFEVLGFVDANGNHAKRVKYDQEGEKLRKQARLKIRQVYDCNWKERAKVVRDRLDRDKIFAKRADTMRANAEATILARMTKLWKTTPGEQQLNKTKYFAALAFKNELYTVTDMAVEIRRGAYPNKFFQLRGKSKDKLYNSIHKTVSRFKAKFDAGELNHLLDPKLTGRKKVAAFKSKSTKPGARGRKPTKENSKMEIELMEWLEEVWSEDKRVSRTMIFRKVLEINPEFRGGAKDPGFLGSAKNWFYYSFAKKYDLSITKLSSVGQKLPDGWPDMAKDMCGKVAAKQKARARPDGTADIRGVRDAHWANTDHVPVWYESVGNYSWGKKGSGRRNARTGGKEKDRFTVQLGCTKGGQKLIPFMIMKAAPVKKKGAKHGHRNSVTYEIAHRLPDANGNTYPPREECYITVSKTANSNQELTELYLKKVILPGLGAVKNAEAPGGYTCDHDMGTLWDDFRGHHAAPVKSFCKSLPFFKQEIIPGGLTPVSQPLDKVINKVFKGHFRDEYDQYILSAPIVNGAPKAPSRQLLCTWVVKAWKKIPEELVKKAWVACGYTPEKDLGKKTREIVPFSDDQVGTLIGKICGEDVRMNLTDPEVGESEPEFPMDEECDSDDELEDGMGGLLS